MEALEFEPQVSGRTDSAVSLLPRTASTGAIACSSSSSFCPVMSPTCRMASTPERTLQAASGRFVPPVSRTCVSSEYPDSDGHRGMIASVSASGREPVGEVADLCGGRALMIARVLQEGDRFFVRKSSSRQAVRAAKCVSMPAICSSRRSARASMRSASRYRSLTVTRRSSFMTGCGRAPSSLNGMYPTAQRPTGAEHMPPDRTVIRPPEPSDERALVEHEAQRPGS